ncbi:O-linked N-acetylglucosamine transferase, SPINDLY family protein [Brunnivagina elsteri]|uniref:O-linked N-acetylglucosamine transferase, SPINDLY family protein n=1 Tax=Brunnivagina elsteri CCALA 953 TaxID=987040 RepID=A0A2A2TKD7_9CYAN|nr:O-linked N-acetylglucosamine transferase, SPINDLY family protein [Calothrix elsteri]PAX56964.1 O-linked N-acetylglucosamine transferase, SPINDLY family protein [Calothrix elsteri CCALA 953]
MNTTNDNLQEKADYYFNQGLYYDAISLYEKAILEQPEVTSNYCFLGLALLLNGKEEEAQITWMLPISELDENEINVYVEKLVNILQTEVEKRTLIEEYHLAWAIRQHIREIKPNDINNLLHICYFADKVDNFIGDELTKLNIIEYIQSSIESDLDEALLLQVLEKLLKKEPLHPISLDFANTCSKIVKDISNYFYIMLSAAMEVGYTYKDPKTAAKLLEIYLTLEPENLEFLRHLSSFYQDASEYSKGIEIAKKCQFLSKDLGEKIAAAHLFLRGSLKSGGYSKEVSLACSDLEELLKQLIKEQPQHLDDVMTLRLMTPAFSIPHIKDTPEDFRNIQNQVATFFQKNIQSLSQEKVIKYENNLKIIKSAAKKEKKLKIGYLSYCFKQHSVGWLARWLFQHHNREKFEINTYIANYMLGQDALQEWYANNCTKAVKLGMSALEIADAINEDEIDILVDLDSITLDISCAVMAVKPAPIQVTWLGWDASGIPAIDYYIADPYVLPDSAQNYYSEKIWRLPNTYIAVDGFEVGIPTLRRDDLNIPSDAVVYLSAQRGYKRHPETTRWQMKIIKEVPNSYFLIKGSADEEVIKQFFYQIAEEEGVSIERLRFLPNVAAELTHRANLSIADVVLDTYPYNGATTTLETLWMGIPIVTRVGEQFVARNSYTMMMNAGIEEGIAWTNEEYIEWGIRFGKDAKLRQKVAWKLHKSRQTAPLWNGKQFTLEMEKAYQQMWEIYRQS